MAGEKLSKRMVDRLEARAKDYIVFDGELPGFGVRVMPNGKRFYLIQYRRHGRTRRVALGQHGVVTAEIARREANRMLGAVRGGGDDPATLRDLERQAATVQELGARFLKEHVAVRCKPTTAYEYRRAVEFFINPFFGKQRVRTVTSADVAELHGKYAHTPYQSNRVLGVLSKMMNLAEVWGMRDKRTNPCDDVKGFPERKRERFLSPEEIERLGAALQEAERSGAESRFAVAAFRLLLLTGCRLREIQTLKWSYIDFKAGRFRLPDSKTGPKTVYLGDAVVELLRKLPEVDGNPYVIVGKLEERHLTDLQHPWRRIRKAAGLEDVRIHDLRHTYASDGVLAGEGLPMIGKLLGHTQVQTTARYAHLADHPVREAATRIAGRLAMALG